MNLEKKDQQNKIFGLMEWMKEQVRGVRSSISLCHWSYLGHKNVYKQIFEIIIMNNKINHGFWSKSIQYPGKFRKSLIFSRMSDARSRA